MATTYDQCKTCGGTLELKDGVRVCTYCGNTYPLSNPQLEDELAKANILRECTRFDEAARSYEQIIKKYRKEDVSEAHWNLLLCEQRVMFETSENGERFPSFYSITDESVEDSMHYINALNMAERVNPVRAKVFEELAEKMTRAKQLYTRIAKTSKPYDVFICFKKTATRGGDTPDTALATDLYNHFAKDYHIFFSERSLRDVVVRDYEPNIYYALYTAKVLLVLCSKKEYVESQWVKNEWSRFHAFAQNPAASKSIIPIFLEDFTPANLPHELHAYQGIRADYHLFDELGKTLANTLKPMDLQAELDKRMQELEAERRKNEEEERKRAEEAERRRREETEKQRREFEQMQQSLQEQLDALKKQPIGAGDNKNATATLLNRMYLALEQGEWQEAQTCAKLVLGEEPLNSQAYLGKLLAELRVTKLSNLAYCEQPFDSNPNYQTILRFNYKSDYQLINTLKGYLSQIRERLRKREEQRRAAADAQRRAEEERRRAEEEQRRQKEAAEAERRRQEEAERRRLAEEAERRRREVLERERARAQRRKLIVTAIVLGVMLLIMLAITIPVTINYEWHEGLRYKKSGSSYYLVDTNGMEELIIPATIRGRRVAGIEQGAQDGTVSAVHITDIAAWCNMSFGDGALYSANKALYLNGTLVKNLVIPGNVKQINAYAFKNYACIESVTFESGSDLTSIEEGAFEGCDALTAVYTDSVEAWCKISFKNMDSNPLTYAKKLYINGELATKLEIPETIKTIKFYAFQNCHSLTSVVVPESVTVIEWSAFGGCAALREITLPFIGSSMTEEKNYQRVLGYIFGDSDDDDVVEKGSGDYKTSSNNDLTSQVPDTSGFLMKYNKYAIPKSLKRVIVTQQTDVPACAFRNCDLLEEIVFAKGIASKGSGAFENCNATVLESMP